MQQFRQRLRLIAEPAIFAFRIAVHVFVRAAGFFSFWGFVSELLRERPAMWIC
jgi:hypothetical protein